ncbi:MAG: hypothetical protein OEW35_16510 [Gammaproteobacteria bacterium]|nr:hypothetical protein [Gammaproteobacteria bacterium]MDH4255652.1 hypothetical protein [Gammaproteobacteria bacterium]MDH5311200.1 hypothetical protein [Gammaproteobacteria bacterium]
MRSIDAIGTAIETPTREASPEQAAGELLALAEEVLEHWVLAKGAAPTTETREGFRLLALHRQGAQGDPSFNACRETCREAAYHYNLVTMQPDSAATDQRLEMMRLIVNHLFLFVSGKMQVAGLGEFCCSSKPIRLAPGQEDRISKEA